MTDEKAEVQKQYALIEDAKNSQEQWVKDTNSLVDSPDYDTLREVCFHHMELDGPLLKPTLTFVKGFFRIGRLREETASRVLDQIIECMQDGHYAKFRKHEGVSFALSSLPNSMKIHWPEIRKALMKARTANGEKG